MRDRSRNVEDVLPPGTRIEEFEIERALQSGGFGVTYLARDRSLGRRVAIKEYLPREWGGRRADGSVGPRSSSHAKDYQWGLTRFLEEARTLARLDHPRIVRVHRVIEAWGTAYMVMEYVEGRNLEEALKAEGPWPEARVRGLLDSLLPGLAQVHAAGLIHRDIKPANVMLRADGTPVLIDFGAARYAAGAHSHSLTSVLTPGYAPFEQYQTGGKQGAWTDVYALGAVAYRALSGQTPVEATARVRADPLAPVSAAAAGGVSESFGAAVTSALAVWTEDRPQDVAAWRAQWDAGAVPAPSPSPSPAPFPSPSPSPSPARPVPPPPQVEGAAFHAAGKDRGASRNVRRPGPLLAGLAALVLAAGVAVWLIVDQRPDDAPPDGGRVADLPPGGAVPPPVPPDPAAVEAEEERRRAEAETEAEERPDPLDVSPEAAEEALGLDRAGWRRIQEGLAALGLDPGAPDGLVGGGTRRAVRAYQEGAGKPATGFVDAADVTTLHAAAVEADRVADRRAAEAAAAEVERRRAEETVEAAERQRAAAEAERRRAEEAAAAADRRRLAESRRPGHVFRDCDTCPEMVVIPGGRFMMGSPASEEGHHDGEARHEVTLRSFAMGVKEVTFDEWEACVREVGCSGFGDAGWGRGSRPMINVSWADAQAYVQWLSESTGAAYRLPSESEWEYAARAGTTTPFHTGPTISTDQANYDGNTEIPPSVYDSGGRGRYRERTTPVGTFAPNAFGLYDVHGNVSEWVEDCWHGDYSGAPSDGTAWTTGGNCRRRVQRGGSWSDLPWYLRSAARTWGISVTRGASTGFRVARTLD